MPATHVALIRGINVGKAKRVAMADLRALLEKLGYGDVRTLLNSGNIVYTVPAKLRGDSAARIQKACASSALRVANIPPVAARRPASSAATIGAEPARRTASTQRSRRASGGDKSSSAASVSPAALMLSPIRDRSSRAPSRISV